MKIDKDFKKGEAVCCTYFISESNKADLELKNCGNIKHTLKGN